MSLRSRLVIALVALTAVGLGLVGAAIHQAFSRAEYQSLDDRLLQLRPLVVRDLAMQAQVLPVRDDAAEGVSGAGSPPAGELPPLVEEATPNPDGRVFSVPPGTFGRLIAEDGRQLSEVSFADDTRGTPDLSAYLPEGPSVQTVPATSGSGSWRVVSQSLGASSILAMVAVATADVEAALDRLIVIEAAAISAVLLLLGVGAWAILRRGLRPLESMAQAAAGIGADTLDHRLPVESPRTEVGRLATKLNVMLQQFQDAFVQREATEAKLRRFIADASHELRTPLTSIQGYAEVFRLGRDKARDVDIDLVARRIEAESVRMGQLVEDMLTLAHLDEGEAIQHQQVDLTTIVVDAATDARVVDPDRAVNLEAPEPVHVCGEEEQLRRAIGNLVTNALRHTPSQALIEIAVAVVDQHAVVTVRDHGEGIDQADMPHLFQRFFQADPSRHGPGAGLGLAIVAAIAADHDGTVAAENAAGGGARFTLQLPLAAAGR